MQDQHGSGQQGEPPAAPTGRGRGFRRFWPPLALLVAGGATMGWLQWTDLLPGDGERFLATASCAALLALLVALWFIFFTGLKPWVRWSLLTAGMLAVLSFTQAVKVVGVSGNMVPQFAWRWSEEADDHLRGPLPGAVKDAQGAIKLVRQADRDYPQFLGPDRNGVLEGPRLARDWKARPPRLLWRRAIGAGWSSFAVVGDYAITQEQRGQKELVVCYELMTGKPVWSHADQVRYSSTIAGDGPRATPTVAKGRVFALGASGRLNCLLGETGEVLWSRDVLAQNAAPAPQWGVSCSPAVIDRLVVVSAGGSNGRSLVAYDQASGKLAWAGGNDPMSYSSPLPCTLADARQILVVTAQSLASHDPTDGRELWRYNWPGGQPKVPQPVVVGPSQVLIAAGYGIGSQLLSVRREADGWNKEVMWKSRLLKPKFTNIVVREGFAYGLDDGRSLVCLDLATGERIWRGGRYGHGQVLLVGELLLVVSDRGDVALVEANPSEHRELSRFKAIEGQTWNNPALAGRYLLVRNAQEAACYELAVE